MQNQTVSIADREASYGQSNFSGFDYLLFKFKIKKIKTPFHREGQWSWADA